MGMWWLGVILGTMPLSSASHRTLFRSGKFWKMSKPSSVKWPVVHPLSSDPWRRESGSIAHKAKSARTPSLHWPPGKLSRVRQGWAKAPGGCEFLPPAAEPGGFCPCILCRGTAWEAGSSPDLLPHFRGDLPWSGTLARLQRHVSKAAVKCCFGVIRWLPPALY